MKIDKFEDILVWQKGRDLAKINYRAFSSCQDYSFKNQILRATISISNNIAEGFERKGDKEFRRFLYIAKGSAGEVRSMVYIAHELGYINNKDARIIYSKSLEISKMLSGFIKKLT